MATGTYVLYVGTYTDGNSVGLHVYDMDTEDGSLIERTIVPISNAAHVTISRNGKYLYSIADEGVEAYEILEDGDLRYLNQSGIRGMRGRYISTDLSDKFLYVGGYHDAKVTVLRLEEDGRIGDITDGIFHKSTGSVADRNFRPHVSCVIPTPDDQYLCAVDIGLDQVKVYRVNKETGKLRLVDIVRCELESGPRVMLFSKDGKYAYLINEIKNYISVYSYDNSGVVPQFEEIQRVKTLNTKYGERGCAASGMKISEDGKHLYCSNAGQNTMGIFEIDRETGLLTEICILPVSGDYPKDLDVFPDGKHLFALNHESNCITMFRMDYKKKFMTMNHKPVRVDTPNCAVVHRLNKKRYDSLFFGE